MLVAEAFRIPREPEAISVKGLRVGVSRSPVWREIEPAGEQALDLAARRLEEAGAIVFDLELPQPFNGLHTAQMVIADSEGGVSFLPEYVNANALLSKELKDKVDNVLQITREQLLKAYALADSCRPMLDEMFGEKLDVILTPSSKGEAPVGLHTTGNAVFNQMWTLLHAPNVGVPVCFGPANLPVGVTLVGPRLMDSRLLAISAACAPIIDRDAQVRKQRLWPA